jgi:hypothetical protein
MLSCGDFIRIDPAYYERLRACGLERVESILSRVEGRVAAWSRTTDTVFVRDPLGGPGFYLKRYYYPTFRKRLRSALRGTLLGINRASAEARALKTLANSGVPTVRPVAVGGRRRLGLLTACFVITEEVPGSMNLTSFAQEVAAGRRRVTRPWRRACADVLGRQVAAMHAEGVSHGQLFWRNILIRSGITGHPEFFMLDTQPIARFERVGPGPAWWLRELAQLAVSAAPFTSRCEQIRFIRAYFSARRLDARLKQHVRTIAELQREHAAHERQRVKMNRLFEDWNRQLELETLSETRP